MGNSEGQRFSCRFSVSSVVPCCLLAVVVNVCVVLPCCGDEALLKKHCAKCHKEVDPEGDFRLGDLGVNPTSESLDYWIESLEYVKSKEMPPADESELSDLDRTRLTKFLANKIHEFNESSNESNQSKPRRMNNRELANSIADVLMIEDVGTHQPTANLLGDTLEDGFDTDGDALGMSQYHLEQYIEAVRKIVDATVLSGERPESRKIEVKTSDLKMTSRSQRGRAERANRTATSIDFLDIRLRIYFGNFEVAPESGRYRIKIRATGVDRARYDSEETGIYDDDPIRLKIHLGDRTKVVDLPDNNLMDIELDEWIAKGTRIELSYPTDGLRLRNNGNFKFQYAIAHDYLKENDPKLYAKVVRGIKYKNNKRTSSNIGHWSHWTNHWQGPRPRIFNSEIEGPIFETWPPKRQVALLGEKPTAENAANILAPIAQRAWRRTLKAGEIGPIAELVKSRSKTLGEIEALKEGIVAILVSPSFLIINSEDGDPAERFTSKLSYFLQSTTPRGVALEKAKAGDLQGFESVLGEVTRQFEDGSTEEFLREFPQAWLQLDRINFMAPDPDQFRLYDRKRLSEDMIAEVHHFFRHAIENNVPIPELLSADYSFINADLANVYGVAGVPQDSKLRKYTFTDGRRGGLLGMGAFLTLTADSLGTSPIHRAVYVMENFLGIHPSPPPPNVNISEPDVRQAKTIKQILAAHMSDSNCASCHKTIDPYGYAFENFGPMGEWRTEYANPVEARPSRKKVKELNELDKQRVAQGLAPLPRPWEDKPIAVDAAAKFRSGEQYRDIVEYRQLMCSVVNRDRFVRCFIAKLLTYANGEPPTNYSEVEKILAKSADCEYRIVDTIAAVVDSPLFRE